MHGIILKMLRAEMRRWSPETLLLMTIVIVQSIYFSSCEEISQAPEGRKLLSTAPPSTTGVLTIDSMKVGGRQDDDALLKLSNSDSDLTATNVPVLNHHLNFPSASLPAAAYPEEEEEGVVAPEMRNATSLDSVAAIRLCGQRGVEELNACLREALKEMRPRMAGGIPELGVPGVDPLRLDHLAFHHQTGPVTISAQFTNVEVTGLSQFNKSDFWVDISRRRLDFDVTFPSLLLAGSYELSGNMFFVPISGVGNFWLSLGGVGSKGAGTLIATSKSGESGRRVGLKSTELDLNIDSIKVQLTNLFNGDNLLGSVVNTFLNENSQDIFEELRPQIAVQVKDMLTMLANQTLVALPVDFLDDVPLDPSSDDGSVLTENSDSKNNDRNSYRSLPISSANLTSYS